jgi:probable HAF family extracellular repeat protein
MKRIFGKTYTGLISLAVILTIPLVFSHPAASAVEYTVTLIDFPGATETMAMGINDAGDIVGAYQDASEIPHGFLYVRGNFTTIDFPGASGTWAYGINIAGDIMGAYQDATGYHGFLATPVKTRIH